MGFFNWASKMGRKAWRSAKNTVSNVYQPIKKVVSTIHKGSQFVDSLLDKATQFGVPSSLIDIIRDNPIYSTIHGAIETVDDLVEKDLPRIGGAVEDFVEHNLLQNHAPDLGRARGQVQDIIGQARGIRQRVGGLVRGVPATGFTPNRDPSSRQFMSGGMTQG
mgnify:CR=1 FL=1